MEWFYVKDGQQVGPFTTEALAAKKDSGEVAPTDLIWKEGMTDWLPIQQVAEFGGVQPPAPQAGPPAMQAPPAGGPQPKIESYLWQAIVVTLLCCMPLGVVGIVYAAKVDDLVASGQIDRAHIAAANAKKFTMIGFWVGLAVVVAYIGLVFLGALAGM